MRLKEPTFPMAEDQKQHDLFRRMTLFFRDIVNQVNGITEGNITSTHNAYTTAPTTGQHQQGDMVINSTPTESGTAGSKYIIHGWRCTVTGTPGTWVQIRTLTGN